MVSHWKDFLSVSPRVEPLALWYFPSSASSWVPADCWYWFFCLACSRNFFLVYNCYFAIKLISKDLRPPSLLKKIGRWHFIYKCKLQIFHNGFKCQKCEFSPCPPPLLIWADVELSHETKVIWLNWIHFSLLSCVFFRREGVRNLMSRKKSSFFLRLKNFFNLHLFLVCKEFLLNGRILEPFIN